MVRKTAGLVEQMTRRGVARSVTERRLAQTGLGILRALQNSTMTIRDAERDLFNLDTYRAVRSRHYDPRLVEFLEWGMELDDVASVAPEGLPESIAAMEGLVLDVIRSSLAQQGGAKQKRAAAR